MWGLHFKVCQDRRKHRPGLRHGAITVESVSNKVTAKKKKEKEGKAKACNKCLELCEEEKDLNYLVIYIEGN